jgi:hypothetical protein
MADQAMNVERSRRADSQKSRLMRRRCTLADDWTMRSTSAEDPMNRKP